MTKLLSRFTTRDQRGFTLIELLVVIAIIAILAALILAALNAAQQGSRDGKRRSDSTQIRSGLVQMKSDDGVYPATPSGNNVSSIPGIGTYLNPVPSMNNGNTAQKTYKYTQTNVGENFDVCIQLERGGQYLHTTATDQTVNSTACPS